MKVWVLVGVMCAFCAGVASAQDYVPGEVIVQFRDRSAEIFSKGATELICIYGDMMSYLEAKKIADAEEIYPGSKGVKNIYVLRFPTETDIVSIAKDIKLFPEVEDASPNYRAKILFEPNDFYYNHDWWVPPYLLGVFPDTIRCKDQWNLTGMRANLAWNIERGSPSVTVAILDTGIDYFHPDLEGNIWVNPGEDVDHDGVVWDQDDLADTLDDDHDGKLNDLIGWDFVFDDNDP